jgi:hypothetical protein
MLRGRSREHVSDDDLLQLMDGELSAANLRRVHTHLELCWDCRRRSEMVQATIFQFVGYRKEVAAPYMPPPAAGRARFLRGLDRLIVEAKTSWWSRVSQRAKVAASSFVGLVFASGVSVIAVLVGLLLWHHNAPTVSASELLGRAAVWDKHPAPEGQRGVVFQRMVVSNGKHAVERTLYRDAEGHRKPRVSAPDPSEQQIKSALERAGVNWQQPLSAADYQEWHDGLAAKRDEVRRIAPDMFTLITRPGSDELAEASLTVREYDFHPVARRLVFRNSEEVEIAEINYDILSWDAVNVTSLFEADPLPPATHSTAVRPKPVVPPEPESAPLPSPAALEESELRVRLALNDIGADFTDQLAVTQSPNAIEVSGVVQDEGRLKELQDSLFNIPLVSLAVKSIDELGQPEDFVGPVEPEITSVKAYFLVLHGSPLEAFLAQKNISPKEAATVGLGLFNSALRMQKETLALTSLSQRYTPQVKSTLSPRAIALLDELIGRHIAGLHSAITEQRSLVDVYAPSAPAVGETERTMSSAVSLDDLRAAADQNKTLCDELMAPTGDVHRSVPEVFADLERALDRIATMAKSLDGFHR